MKIFICWVISLITLCQGIQSKEMKADIHLEYEIRRNDTINYLILILQNISSKNLYLNNFNLTNYLVIKDKEKEILLDFLLEDAEKKVSNIKTSVPLPKDSIYFSRNFNSDCDVQNKFGDLIKCAVKLDYDKIINLNSKIIIDSVFQKAIKYSLFNKYKDAIFLKTGDIYSEKIDLSSLYRLKRNCVIYFEYPQEFIPQKVVEDYLFSDENLHGRNDKIILKYPYENSNNVNGYKPFNKKICSNKLILNFKK